MSNLKFDGNAARVHGMLAQCHDAVVRRTGVLQAVNLKTGERAMEFGCGAGFYAFEAAQFVGPTGQISAIDISEDQIAATKARCADLQNVDVRVADITALPFDSETFDAIWGVQVLEYVTDVDLALAEIRRVLRPGGRLIILATNWHSIVWHSENPERMQRVLRAFDAHCPDPNQPSKLHGKIRSAGLQVARQTPMPVLNTTYRDALLSRWIAPLVEMYVVGQNSISKDEAEAWISEFEDLDRRGEYWFASLPMVTEAVKL